MFKTQFIRWFILCIVFAAIGTVCFDCRLGVLSPRGCHSPLAQQMLTNSQLMFSSVQKTTFAFPWFFFFRTKLYKDFVTGKKGCNRWERMLYVANLGNIDTFLYYHDDLNWICCAHLLQLYCYNLILKLSPIWTTQVQLMCVMLVFCYCKKLKGYFYFYILWLTFIC